ncbi:hypothetical protein AB7378_13825 [Providencia rettgeri]|uniref:hypothetical protein n=1 Tax=uncultured Providencia sp. TaxID=390517 RepID=UPI003010024D
MTLVFFKRNFILSSKYFIFLSLIVGSIITIIPIYVGLNNSLFILNENQILYLYSNSSQVLAAIYGLTLTGFIFFRNELSRNEASDDTLSDATDSLKKRYRSQLIFITILSVSTLITSNVVISIESSEWKNAKIILMNLSQSLFILSLIVISFFIFDILEPKRIEKESLKIQSEIDPQESMSDKGDLSEFLKNFNKIEDLLKEYGSPLYSGTGNIKFISNKILVNTIYRNELIDNGLRDDINKLVSLRNSIVHGAEPTVSNAIVELSKEVLERLLTSLSQEKN